MHLYLNKQNNPYEVVILNKHGDREVIAPK